MFKNIGTAELIIIVVVLLILFGGKKLPELGKGLGDAVKEFKNAFKGKTDKS
jgi:sec-independent protein translocase protein TatA